MVNIMKNTLSKLILLSIFILIRVNGYCQDDEGYNAIINHIKSRIGCSYENAETILHVINFFSESIQAEFTDLASSSDPISEKESRIKYVIAKYFESANSMVQVSSITKKKRGIKYIFSYPIRTYLYRLAQLNKYKYTRVELLYEPDYLGIGTFEKLGDNRYELSVSMWQLFRAWIDETLVYEDATRKKFRLCFILDEDTNTAIVSISEILVSETVDIKKFRKL